MAQGNQGGRSNKSRENLPEDVQRILKKAERGETLNHSEVGVLGGHDIQLSDFGIQEPSEREGQRGSERGGQGGQGGGPGR